MHRERITNGTDAAVEPQGALVGAARCVDAPEPDLEDARALDMDASRRGSAAPRTRRTCVRGERRDLPRRRRRRRPRRPCERGRLETLERCGVMRSAAERELPGLTRVVRLVAGLEEARLLGEQLDRGGLARRDRDLTLEVPQHRHELRARMKATARMECAGPRSASTLSAASAAPLTRASSASVSWTIASSRCARESPTESSPDSRRVARALSSSMRAAPFVGRVRADRDGRRFRAPPSLPRGAAWCVPTHRVRAAAVPSAECRARRAASARAHGSREAADGASRPCPRCDRGRAAAAEECWPLRGRGGGRGGRAGNGRGRRNGRRSDRAGQGRRTGTSCGGARSRARRVIGDQIAGAEIVRGGDGGAKAWRSPSPPARVSRSCSAVGLSLAASLRLSRWSSIDQFSPVIARSLSTDCRPPPSSNSMSMSSSSARGRPRRRSLGVLRADLLDARRHGLDLFEVDRDEELRMPDDGLSSATRSGSEASLPVGFGARPSPSMAPIAHTIRPTAGRVDAVRLAAPCRRSDPTTRTRPGNGCAAARSSCPTPVKSPPAIRAVGLLGAGVALVGVGRRASRGSPWPLAQSYHQRDRAARAADEARPCDRPAS